MCGARALNTARSAFALLAAVARRRLWDLLLASKAGRVTLLTTHVLPEADTLGDVIGIMHEGSLKCAGSSLFLKRRFGVGYHLKVVRKSGAGPARRPSPTSPRSPRSPCSPCSPRLRAVLARVLALLAPAPRCTCPSVSGCLGGTQAGW